MKKINKKQTNIDKYFNYVDQSELSFRFSAIKPEVNQSSEIHRHLDV